MFTLTESLDDENEMNEAREHDIEFFKAGKDAAEAFQTAEEAFDFMAFLVEGFVVFPRGNPVGFWRHHRRQSKLKSQLAGFIPLTRSIHDQMTGRGRLLPFLQEFAPRRSIPRLPGR